MRKLIKALKLLVAIADKIDETRLDELLSLVHKVDSLEKEVEGFTQVYNYLEAIASAATHINESFIPVVMNENAANEEEFVGVELVSLLEQLKAAESQLSALRAAPTFGSKEKKKKILAIASANILVAQLRAAIGRRS